MRSRRTRRIAMTALAGVVSTILTGCQSGMAPKQSLAASEPTLTLPGDPEPKMIVDAGGPSKSPEWVARHPLFSKPRDVYENTNSNKAVKVVGATVVGIPMGVFGELKQIVVGNPAPKGY